MLEITIEKLLLLLKEEKEIVNNNLINKEWDLLMKNQFRCSCTTRALRRLIKMKYNGIFNR